MMDGTWFSKIPDMTGLLEHAGLIQLLLYACYGLLGFIIFRRFAKWRRAAGEAQKLREEEQRLMQAQQLATQQEMLQTIQQQNEIIKQYQNQGRN